MELLTERLRLVPCTLDLARSAAEGDRRLLGAMLGVTVPPQWPLADLAGFLPQWKTLLTRDPALAPWGVWLVIQAHEGLLIGDAGFKGRPSRQGTVELGCGILPAWRCLGYGTEASRGLIDWVGQQEGVWAAYAEAETADPAAHRVLERLGFCLDEAGKERELWRLDIG